MQRDERAVAHIVKDSRDEQARRGRVVEQQQSGVYALGAARQDDNALGLSAGEAEQFAQLHGRSRGTQKQNEPQQQRQQRQQKSRMLPRRV